MYSEQQQQKIRCRLQEEPILETVLGEELKDFTCRDYRPAKLLHSLFTWLNYLQLLLYLF